MQITYKSDNGYTGVIGGTSSMSIFNQDGHEIMHSGFRNINTYDELKEFVDNFPEWLVTLHNAEEKIYREEAPDYGELKGLRMP